MRYTVKRFDRRLYRVFDTHTRAFTRGRFHTRAEANEWIDTQKARGILASLALRGDPRPRAYLITDSDYAGSNENLIRRIAAAVLAR